MTTLTENAVEAIRLYARRQVPPQAPQIRIAAEGDDGGLGPARLDDLIAGVRLVRAVTDVARADVSADNFVPMEPGLLVYNPASGE